jgi:hypothetical protein
MINYTDLYASLAIMGKGMLGLFVVCASVAIIVMVIAKIVRKTGKIT